MPVQAKRAFSPFLGLILFALIAFGCGPVVKKPTFVGLPGTQAPVVTAEYRINPGDQLDIKFFYNPELNEEQIVRPDGKISLQLIDEIMAAGRTPAELTTELKEKYTEELASPAVTVIVKSSSNMKIYVDGEVLKPGVLPLLGSMTVLQAIASSGGLKDTARREEVIVIRQKDDLTGPMAIPINIKTIIDGTQMGEDILLKPYDIVYIPASPIGNASKWVDLYLRRTILVVPQDFLLYYNALKD